MSKPPLIDTQKSKQEYCLIVHIDMSALQARASHKGGAKRTLKQTQEEIEGLSKAINLDIVHTHCVKPKTIYAGSYLGKGQRETIADLVEHHKPDILIFNGTLSPIQQRNLEKEWKVKVIDRTGLILEIFGERAQTKEGRLQVDLAMLEYQKSRLVRSWTHLERQRGGAGFMGGPGETQIELDRRIISDKITRLKQDIAAVKRTRDLGRESRARVPFPIVALVGYTNAGKSTLFNRLTDADVMAEDLLFATLDPTMRRLTLPKSGHDVILADTVGFIANLPTQLVAAFRSTLEQVTYADIILHVIDASQEDYEAQRSNVISILSDLGLDYETDDRIIEVYNKYDAMTDDLQAEITRSVEINPDKKIAISALNGAGQDRLFDLLNQYTFRKAKFYEITLPIEDGKAASWLYRHANIHERNDSDAKTIFKIQIDEANKGRFMQEFPNYTLKLL